VPKHAEAVFFQGQQGRWSVEMSRIEQIFMIMTMVGLTGLVASVGWLLLI